MAPMRTALALDMEETVVAGPSPFYGVYMLTDLKVAWGTMGMFLYLPQNHDCFLSHHGKDCWNQVLPHVGHFSGIRLSDSGCGHA